MMPKIRTYILILLASALYPIFLLEGGRTNERAKSNIRILIIPQYNRIGDLISTTPMYKAIKQRYPKSFLAVIVGKGGNTGDVIKNNPYVDDIILFEQSEYWTFFGIFRLFRKIRRKRFDCSINVSASVSGTLISVYGLIPRRIKIIRPIRSLPELLSDWMNTDGVHYSHGVYLPAFFLRILDHIDVPMPSKIEKEIYTSKSGDDRAERFLKEMKILPPDVLIGVSVSAGTPVKEWGIEKFKVLIADILEKYKAKIVFIGVEKDLKKIREVNSHINNKGVVAAGLFSLEEIPSLIKQLSVFISADTGPIHIAEALNVPLIDIVGPVDPHALTPRGRNSIIIRPPHNIQPTIFALLPSGDLEESMRAMESIQTETVMKALDDIVQLRGIRV